MANLTEEQKANYVKHPNTCPYCGSDNISAGPFESVDMFREVQCQENDCLKIWRDCYTLTSIEEEDTDEQLPESISTDGSIAIQEG